VDEVPDELFGARFGEISLSPLLGGSFHSRTHFLSFLFVHYFSHYECVQQQFPNTSVAVLQPPRS
jgi:hypothetical protein